MKRIRAFVLAAVVFAFPLLVATPSQAMTCAPDLEDACRIVFTVVCAPFKGDCVA